MEAPVQIMEAIAAGDPVRVVHSERRTDTRHGRLAPAEIKTLTAKNALLSVDNGDTPILFAAPHHAEPTVRYLYTRPRKKAAEPGTGFFAMQCSEEAEGSALVAARWTKTNPNKDSKKNGYLKEVDKRTAGVFVEIHGMERDDGVKIEITGGKNEKSNPKRFATYMRSAMRATAEMEGRSKHDHRREAARKVLRMLDKGQVTFQHEIGNTKGVGFSAKNVDSVNEFSGEAYHVSLDQSLLRTRNKSLDVPTETKLVRRALVVASVCELAQNDPEAFKQAFEKMPPKMKRIIENVANNVEGEHELRMIQRRQVEFLNLGHAKSVYLTEQEMVERGLSNGEKISFKLGQETINIKVRKREQRKQDKQGSTGIRFSEDIKKEFPMLSFVADKPLGIVWRQEDKTLQVGPIVAVLSRVTKNGKSFSLGQSYLTKAFSRESQNTGGGIVVAVDPKWVDLENKTMKGLYMTSDRRWRTLENMPLPDVAFNRVIAVSGESHKLDARTRNRLNVRKIDTGNGITLVNSEIVQFLARDKFAADQALRKHDSSLQTHLAETRMLNSADDLSIILNQHKVAFMKPRYGTEGAGIVKAELGKDGRISYSYRDGGRKVKGVVESTEELMDKTRGVREGDYIVQQGINLATVSFDGDNDSRSFDLRTFVQRLDTDDWEVTGVGARVSGTGQITSNLATGGFAARPEEVLTRIFGKNETKKIIRESRNLAWKTARAIEKASGRPAGEIAVDVGIDADGKPWVIEVNTQPGRKTWNTVIRPYDAHTFNRLHNGPYLSALRAAGFTIEPEVKREQVETPTVIDMGSSLICYERSWLTEEKQENATKTIFVRPEDREWMGLRTGDEVKIKYDLHSVKVKVGNALKSRRGESTGRSQAWRVSRDVASEMPVPDYMPLRSTWDSETKELRMGPLVGVAIRTNDGVGGRVLGGDLTSIPHPLFRMVKENAGLGAGVYVFDPRSVDYANKTVEAYFPEDLDDKDPKAVVWKKVTMPLPDRVWMNYLGQVGNDVRTKMHKEFNAMGVEFMGSDGFTNIFEDKLAFDEFMRTHPDYASMLPETKLVTESKGVMEMLDKHTRVVLKPRVGTLGKDVFWIEKRQGKYVRYRQIEGKSGRIKYLERANRNEFEDVLESMLSDREGAKQFICQQAVESIRIESDKHTSKDGLTRGRVADFRVLTQKTSEGTWDVTGVGSRVGKYALCYKTNLSAGGDTYSAKKVLMEVFAGDEKRVDSILQDMKKVCLDIASFVQSKKGRGTEIGFDIMIDRQGKMWLIEGNSMPARDLFERLGLKTTSQISYQRPVIATMSEMGFGI